MSQGRVAGEEVKELTKIIPFSSHGSLHCSHTGLCLLLDRPSPSFFCRLFPPLDMLRQFFTQVVLYQNGLL